MITRTFQIITFRTIWFNSNNKKNIGCDKISNLCVFYTIWWRSIFQICLNIYRHVFNIVCSDVYHPLCFHVHYITWNPTIVQNKLFCCSQETVYQMSETLSSNIHNKLFWKQKPVNFALFFINRPWPMFKFMLAISQTQRYS